MEHSSYFENVSEFQRKSHINYRNRIFNASDNAGAGHFAKYEKKYKAPPRGKRTQEEEEGAVQDAGQDRAGEGSFAGPSGTSGGGASAEVVVLDEDSGEEAVQVPDVPVRVHTVVAGRVAPSKSTRPSRREQARMARQRRLDATVAEYRRLVALEEEDTQSTGTTTTTSTGTAASSSVPPRAASQRSAPAVSTRSSFCVAAVFT
ncbi:uncharacterized protein LOC144762253 [Lissotriton helveticus]